MMAETLALDDPAYLAAARAQVDASNPNASAWVTANAGAGKTKVLVDRVARLLHDWPEKRERERRLFTPDAAAAVVKEPGLAALLRRLRAADARLPVEEFEEKVGTVLTEEEREEVDTLGGLVVSLAGRVPGRGETLRHSSGLEFEIIDADSRRLKRLRVRNAPANMSALAETA